MATTSSKTADSSTRPVVLLVATRKGAWLFHGDAGRKNWRAEGPHFLGHIIHHLVLDPRDGKTLLAAASTGHLGPTMFRSRDWGKTWQEAKKPPAFAKVPEGAPADAQPSKEQPVENAPAPKKGRVVTHTFWLTPGHADEPDVWYAGTSPQGVFRSSDGGDTWEGLPGLNDNPDFLAWMGDSQGGTPDGPTIHSLIVDPRDRKHLYIGMSSGGVHESTDAGATWQPLVDGMEVVAGFDATKIYFHDPHCVRMCPSNPDRLYQQNHCGIYRLDRPGTTWERIGKAMPPDVGDIGFPMVVHPENDEVCWVFPMDGSDVWPRVSPGGKPAVYSTRDGGSTWQRQDKGMPAEQAWWTVKRQAMTRDDHKAVGLYFGTTHGELWMSADEGASWTNIARHLPEIYAVETALL